MNVTGLISISVRGYHTQVVMNNIWHHCVVHIENGGGWWWLSGCLGSVAEHRRLEPEVSWIRFLATAGLFTFAPHNIYFQREARSSDCCISCWSLNVSAMPRSKFEFHTYIPYPEHSHWPHRVKEGLLNRAFHNSSPQLAVVHHPANKTRSWWMQHTLEVY